MAKRSARRRAVEAEMYLSEVSDPDPKVRRLFPSTSDDPWRGESGQSAKRAGPDSRYVKNVEPKSQGQARLMSALDSHSLVVALGPAGSGKTFLAVAKAVEALERGDVGRIVLSRPAVDAGETIGFLPGDVQDKLAPYLRPLYDALTDRLSAKRLKVMLAEGLIEIAPIAFMRGRTLNNAYVVIDEAQNCTYQQLKMCLTRLGWQSTMVVAGDPNQTDLLPDLSGLRPVAQKLRRVEGAKVVQLDKRDIVRHPLVASMLEVL